MYLSIIYKISAWRLNNNIAPGPSGVWDYCGSRLHGISQDEQWGMANLMLWRP